MWSHQTNQQTETNKRTNEHENKNISVKHVGFKDLKEYIRINVFETWKTTNERTNKTK